MKTQTPKEKKKNENENTMWSWRFESIALSVHFIDCVKISLYLQILGNDFYSGSGFFPKRCFNLIWFEQNIPCAISFACIKNTYFIRRAHTQKYIHFAFGHLNHPQSADCIDRKISIKCTKIQINTFYRLSTGNYSPKNGIYFEIQLKCML